MREIEITRLEFLRRRALQEDKESLRELLIELDNPVYGVACELLEISKQINTGIKDGIHFHELGKKLDNVITKVEDVRKLK